MDASQQRPKNFESKPFERAGGPTENAASNSKRAGSNLGAECGPDIFRLLAELHLPRPKIPIPEWRVKQ